MWHTEFRFAPLHKRSKIAYFQVVTRTNVYHKQRTNLTSETCWDQSQLLNWYVSSINASFGVSMYQKDWFQLTVKSKRFFEDNCYASSSSSLRWFRSLLISYDGNEIFSQVKVIPSLSSSRWWCITLINLVSTKVHWINCSKIVQNIESTTTLWAVASCRSRSLSISCLVLHRTDFPLQNLQVSPKVCARK